MPLITDPIVKALQRAISAPREDFEESKKYTIRTLLKPALFIIGSEGIIIGVLGAIKTLKVGFGNFAAELAGSASENMLLLSIMVIIAFLSTLGANIYKSHLSNKSRERLLIAVDEANRRENYRTLVDEYYRCQNHGEIRKSRFVANWILNRYPELLESDETLLKEIIGNISEDELIGLLKEPAAIGKPALPVKEG